MGLFKKKTPTAKKKESIMTGETLGVILILFATLSLVCMIAGESIFGDVGEVIGSFILGVFGYFGYLVQIYSFTLGIRLLTDKDSPFTIKARLLGTVAFLSLAIFCQVLTVNATTEVFGEYVSASFNGGTVENKIFSAGGAVTGIITYFFLKILSYTGALVVSGILFGISAYALVKSFSSKAVLKSRSPKFKGSYIVHEDDKKEEKQEETPIAPQTTQSFEGPIKPQKPEQRLFINHDTALSFKSKREMTREDPSSILKIDHSTNGLVIGRAGSPFTEEYEKTLQQKIEYIKSPAPIKLEKPLGVGTTQVSNVIKETPKEQPKEQNKPIAKNIPIFEHEEKSEYEIADDAKSHADAFSRFANLTEPTEVEADHTFRPLYTETEKPVETKVEEKPTVTFTESTTIEDAIEKYEEVEEVNEVLKTPEIKEEPTVRTSIFDEPIKEEIIEEIPKIKEIEEIEDIAEIEEVEEIEEISSPITSNERVQEILFGDSKKDVIEDKSLSFEQPKVSEQKPAMGFGRTISQSVPEVKAEEKPEEKKKEIPPINRRYFRPPLELLKTYVNDGTVSEDHETRKAIIKQTLEDFNINAEPVGQIQGPTVTRYEVMMPAGVPVKKILTHDDDLRMRLASISGIRIQAPIPGKNLVGIEVANSHAETVGLKEILAYMQKREKKGKLDFAIGKDIVGNAIVDDLSKGPHFLVAGTTGSGKSVCLNIMIVSLIMQYSPEELRLILVDPKGNEFIPYQHIPHLMIDEIITQPKKALAALAWAQEEMEKRYKLLANMGGVRDIDAYNQKIDDKTPRMPRIVFVVDELSNLMETCKREMEARILSIAQKARAVGIHMVLATQRPSVDIITGTIKGNLPSRIALKVTSFADSSTILGQGGAEKLLGHGDMLYKNSSMGETERYQGAWITDDEIYAVVDYIKDKNKAYFDDEMSEFLEKEMRAGEEPAPSATSQSVDGGKDEVDSLFLQALAHGLANNGISISMIQRRFQVGYAKAGGIVDKMERMGLVSGNEGSKARRILITREEFTDRFGVSPDAV